MRDLLPTLNEWSADDPLVAIATVVGTSGSTPRPMGARLLVSRDPHVPLYGEPRIIARRGKTARKRVDVKRSLDFPGKKSDAG